MSPPNNKLSERFLRNNMKGVFVMNENLDTAKFQFDNVNLDEDAGPGEDMPEGVNQNA